MGFNHADRIEAALARHEAAKAPLVASWQRSKSLYYLDPDTQNPPERLSEHELKRAREKSGRLIKNSEASLDHLYQALGDVGCSVILANNDGVPLTRRGSAANEADFYRWGLWTGAIWSEESEGTNGIGTCIVEQRPLTIHKDQHFHSKNIGLSCSAAPIFDHTGNLMAVLDASSCREDLSEGFSRLISVAVTAAAQKIEANCFSDQFSGARIILVSSPDHATNSQWRSAALIAVDNDDIVIGATREARKIYGLKDDDIKRQVPLYRLTGQSTDRAHEYATAEQRIIHQTLASTKGNVSAAAQLMGISRATLHRKIKKFNLDS